MMKPKILYILYYNSELGGLHDNVFSTATEASQRGYDVYVACREGLFQERLRSSGLSIINIDQDEKINSINTIINQIGTDIHLIHAHPGNSRIIALRLARAYDIPIIYHVHGAWTDNIKNYIAELSSVFTVSNSVKENIVRACPHYEHKIHIIPNYSDYKLSNNEQRETNANTKTVTLISRLESDKSLVVNKVKSLKYFLNETNYNIVFNIIGEGSLRAELENFFVDNIYNENIKILFLGWIPNKQVLKTKILESDLIIGPGRVAIDALTLQRPVIVVGSQNYYGIINDENWQHFVSSNFGGIGPRPTEEEDISRDLKTFFSDKNNSKISVEIGTKVIQTFFNKHDILEKMFNIYDILLFKKFK